MKKVINGKMYNTETAEIVMEHWNGYSSRDFNYCYEELHRKKTGEFFLYGKGGALSKYADHCANMMCDGEKIIPLTEREAREYVERHGDADKYIELFGEVEE